MTDKIILIVCGVLFALLVAVLIWWLKAGKRHFIDKRCPKRIVTEKEEADDVKTQD